MTNRTHMTVKISSVAKTAGDLVLARESAKFLAEMRPHVLDPRDFNVFLCEVVDYIRARANDRLASEVAALRFVEPRLSPRGDSP